MGKAKKLTIKEEINDFLLYTTPGGDVRVEVLFSGEQIWATQEMMSILFDVDRTVITKHLANIFQDGELEEEATSAKFAQVQIPKNFPSAHINITNEQSTILALADVSWKPNDNEMENITFDDYDWDKWQ